MAYYSFTEKPVWQLSQDIVHEVYAITESLPKSEDYGLKGQLRDAALSISGNIAEGFGRHHTKDKINFYYISRGSAFEVLSHLYSGVRVHYFLNQKERPTIEKCKQVIEDLNKLISGLSKSSLYTKPVTSTKP